MMPKSAGTTPATATLRELQQLLADPPEPRALGGWRWSVRRHLASLRDALVQRGGAERDGWLASRSDSVSREGEQLVGRIRSLGPRVIGDEDVAGVRTELKRLATDISHHLQRRSDLAWEQVEQEYGGSE